MYDYKEVKYFYNIKKQFHKTQSMKYHNFIINIYYNDIEDFRSIIFLEISNPITFLNYISF